MRNRFRRQDPDSRFFFSSWSDKAFLKMFSVCFYLLLSAGSLLLLKAAADSPLQLQSNAGNCPKCVLLKDCPQLVELLRIPTTENYNKLRSAQCGFEGHHPKVCCPSGPETTLQPEVTTGNSSQIRQSLLPRDCGFSFTHDRIFGGTVAPLGAFPWAVALMYNEIGISIVRFGCGGSLISERYVLTAAHCLHPKELKTRRLFNIAVGEWDINTDPDCETYNNGQKVCAPKVILLRPQEIVMHEKYDTRSRASDDIALIRLSQAVQFSSYIQPICLAPADFDYENLVQEDRLTFVTGWGLTEKLGFPDRLHYVNLPFVSLKTCNDTYSGQIHEEQLCVGGEPGKDSCDGDSGGPLFVPSSNGPPYIQVGLVSFGTIFCGHVPGVYTSVAHYRNWIEDHMRP